MVDPDCQAKEVLPNGMLTSREVADWVQGTGYQEPTSPNVTVANCVGPRFFVAGETGALDIRSDVTTGAVTTAFEETSQGYHNVIDPSSGAVSFVYGEQVTDAKKMLLEEQGVRGGLWQQRNTVAA